jgi:hypothetical protein
MATEEQTAQNTAPDNGPEQITRPAQFPTATRIENGTAYDASGKALGSVDEKTMSQGGGPTSFRADVKPDPFAALGATSAPAPQKQPQQDPFAALGATSAPAPDGQPAVVEQEKPGAIHKLWDYVNKGLVSKDTIANVFHDAGRLAEAYGYDGGKTVHIPGYGDIDRDTFLKGVGDSTSGVLSSFTSPLSIALLGGGELLQAGKSAQALRAAKTAEEAGTAAEAAEGAHAARTAEATRAYFQSEKAQMAAKAAQEAEAAGTGTNQATVAAQDTASQALANYTKAQRAASETEEALSLHKVKAAQAARDAETATAASKAAGLAGKLPELPKALSTGVGVLSKTAGTGFALMGASQALEPRQPGESDADYAERVLGGAGWGLLGAEALKGTPVDIALGDVPAKVIGLPKDAAEAVKNWREARAAKKEFIQRDADAEQAKKDFKKSIPPTAGAGAYTDNDYAIGRGYLERHIADPNLEPITNASDVADALEFERQRVENKARAAIAIYGKEPVPINVRQYVRERLAADEKVKAGTIDAAMKTLEPYNLTDITLEEGDKTREKLNGETRGVLKKNFWDVKTALETDPEFAARYYANEALREGTWKLLEDKGVTGVREARQDEAALIRLRNAAGKQINKGEVQRRGSSEVSPARQTLAKGVKMAATGAGAGIGAAIGAAIPLLGTTEAGAIAGAKVGEIAASKIAPPDLTVDQLISRSLSKKGGGVEPTDIDTSKAQPSRPPVEVIPPKPREHTPLHSDMATHYGETIGDTPYDDLEKRFLSDVSIKKENKVPLDSSEKSLLKQINQAKVADILAQKKAVEDAAKKEAEATAAAEKEIKTGKVAEAKAEPEKEPEPPKGGGKKVAERTLLEGEKEKVEPVGSHVAKATEGLMPVGDHLPEGHTDLSFQNHEHGHHYVAAMEGIHGTDIISHEHEDLANEPSTAGGIGWQEQPLVFDKAARKGKSSQEIWDNTKKWLRVYMGGAAANEALDGMTLENNSGLRGDLRQAKDILKAHGITGEDANLLIQDAYNQAKNHLTQPGALDIIKANAGVREENLPSTHHASAARLERIREQINDNANKNATANAGTREGGGAVEGGEPQVARRGQAVGAERRAAIEGEVRVPPERSTGVPERDAAIKEGGAIPAGIQKGDPSIGLNELTLFHDPKTGSTLALPSDKVTADLVKQHLAKSREAYGISPLAEKTAYHPDL